MTSTISSETDQPISPQALSLSVAGRFVDRFAAHDFDAAVETLTDDVAFRALLPGKVLDLGGRDAVRATLGTWFGGAERWDVVDTVVDEVGGRIYLCWRIRLTNPDRGPGDFVVEQQVYADAAPDGRLRDMALLCTGYRPDNS